MLLLPPLPYIDLPTYASIIEQRLFEQDIHWRSSSVLPSQASTLPGSHGRMLRLGLAEIPASATDSQGLASRVAYSIDPYSDTTLVISLDRGQQLDEPALDEDWFFKPKPVSRERLEVFIHEIREGSLKKLSLSPFEDSEH